MTTGNPLAHDVTSTFALVKNLLAEMRPSSCRKIKDSKNSLTLIFSNFLSSWRGNKKRDYFVSWNQVLLTKLTVSDCILFARMWPWHCSWLIDFISECSKYSVTFGPIIVKISCPLGRVVDQADLDWHGYILGQISPFDVSKHSWALFESQSLMLSLQNHSAIPLSKCKM